MLISADQKRSPYYSAYSLLSLQAQAVPERFPVNEDKSVPYDILHVTSAADSIHDSTIFNGLPAAGRRMDLLLMPL